MRFNGRAMKRIYLALALALTLPLFAQLAEGDKQFAMRAEGAQNGHAKSEHVDAAIAAYQRAIAANANDVEAYARLLRAYRFKGAYVASTNEEKKHVYGEAKTVGQRAIAVLNRLLSARGVTTKASEKQIGEAARSIPGAADVYLWDSVNWGEWAIAYGKLAAAREGAADRIKHEATIANFADPRLEAGAPSRVLGRLHDQTPRIPFLTGWASQKEAVRFLNESMKIDSTNKVTLVFLAEALVSLDSANKPKAIQILHTLISAPNSARYEVEEAAATNDARAILKKWGQ
jgi:hypothetical protein